MTITIDITPHIEADGIHLTVPRMDDSEFFEFCRRHDDLRIERDAQGEISIMPPAGSEGSNRNANLIIDLGLWAQQDGTGLVFDSSGGFKLPNGATRAPDASWVQMPRWQALTDEQREKFAPLCPDFVVELMSPSDSLGDTQAKMEEYIANGAALGWLIDRKNRQVHIYRPNQPVEVLTSPAEISGAPVLPGFALDLRRIF